LNGRTLEIVRGGIFNSYIKPEFDPVKQKEFGLGPIEQEALDINKISIETLEKAPIAKVVWAEFCEFVNQFNYKKSRWTAPVCAGFNNTRFDNLILDRLAGGNRIYNECEKEPYKFGPWDDGYQVQSLFHPIHCLDLMPLIFSWTENDKDIRSLSFDKLREVFGIDKDGAHNSLVDIAQGALLLVKFLKLQRNISGKMKHKFKDSFEEENKMVKSIVANYIK